MATEAAVAGRAAATRVLEKIESLDSNGPIGLADLLKMDAPAIQTLTVEQIFSLQDELAAYNQRGKLFDGAIQSELARRYSEQAQGQRAADKKDFGSQTIIIGEFSVKCDLPKKVTWDQEKLSEAVNEIISWDENVDEYVSTEYKVSEEAYTNWPSSIKKVFEPARSVSPGTQKFKIERRKK